MKTHEKFKIISIIIGIVSLILVIYISYICKFIFKDYYMYVIVLTVVWLMMGVIFRVLLEIIGNYLKLNQKFVRNVVIKRSISYFIAFVMVVYVIPIIREFMEINLFNSFLLSILIVISIFAILYFIKIKSTIFQETNSK